MASVVSMMWIAAASAESAISGYAQVRDGDTIVVSGVPVRLRGLHCDERGTAGGERARQEMVRLVANTPVHGTLNGDRTHDRRVGWCSVHGEDLGVRLIQGGVCARCAAYDTEERYARIQQTAGPWLGEIPGYCH